MLLAACSITIKEPINKVEEIDTETEVAVDDQENEEVDEI